MMFDKNVFESVWVECKQKLSKNFEKPNVQSLKTTSRKIFRQIVLQLRLRFWTMQHCTCTGLL